jgi:hypothetical protein
MAAQRGGKREGAGRKPGSRNKVTADIKELAQSYGQDGLEVLVKIMRDKDAPHAARVAAVKEIFDRGYGKAKQEMEHTGGLNLNVVTGVPNADADR